ncbi:glutamine synthetase family protein [Gynuella sunshinyii]|uniref:Glutamine synthetase n=1 Tax=Gynuella sunshinyii YC6258 TaxID=1445510 RepID=A0A0C5VUR6_9GAMM|nr:glutamine synthetase family protein [Gynuella sunshinyii]AJQ97891.1 glutamine synthetase [Gynuella sunshinyii YC6258]
MSNDEVSAFLTEYPDVQTIELLITDLNGVVRGKRIERELLEKVFAQGFYLPGSVMALDATGTTVEETGLGVEAGDQDRVCFPIPGTLAIVPWQGNDRAQALVSMFDADGEVPFLADPRQVLARVVEKFSTLDYTPCVAVELEFYLVDRERDANGQLQPPISPVSGRRMNSKQVYSMDDLDDYDFFIREVLDTAHAQNIPADAVVAEYAPGQFEVNLPHVTDPLEAADHAVLLRRVIRQVARRHDMEATFMAKPYIDESGSGTHVHVSLLNDAGDNIFAAEDPLQHPPLRYAVGGLLQMADSVQALLCPNINSYRRLAPGGYAPTSHTWGYDNRTAAIRIPSGEIEATRIEHRMSGADTNPYLAVAVVLAGIGEGLMKQVEPPEPVTNNAYDQDHPQLADNPRDALRAMEANEQISEWFGEEFLRIYSICKWSEVSLFERQVTELEYSLLLPYL